MKVLDKEGPCFQHIMSQFRQLSNAKLKEGIFDEPEIRQLLKDDVFVAKMTFCKTGTKVVLRAPVERL